VSRTRTRSLTGHELLTPEPGDSSTMQPYAGLAEHQREGAITAANETLARIARTQSQFRDAAGRIRRGKFLGAVLGLRYEGFAPKEIAELLGVSHQQVTRALLAVRKDADLDAQVQRLNQIAVPLAMDNVVRGVMNNDKDYTLKVLDGAGVFKSHKAVQSEIKQTVTMLQVQLTMPAHLIGKELPMPKAGQIVGAPTIAVGLPPAHILEGVVIEQTLPTKTPEQKDID
jgi:hypothetical protein